MEYVQRADTLHSPMPQNISDNSFCDLSLFIFSYYSHYYILRNSIQDTEMQ